MSALHLLHVPCLVCDHSEAHKVAVFSDPDGFESNSYRFATPEYCPKCKAIYSVNDLMELQAEIRERVDEHEREYQEHRTGRRQRIA
jgi:hypothetical protein